MSYCAPHKPTYGFLDHGCEVYGGIQVDLNKYCSQEPCSSRDYYIPQHNLAVHWGRPELVPQWNFPRFLCQLITGFGTLQQEVGVPSYDCERRLTRSRNLLAVSNDEQGGDVVKIWAVKEGVSRKKIMCLRQKYAYDEKGCKTWTLEGEGDGITSGIAMKRPMIRVNRSELQYLEDYVQCRCIDLDTPLLELVSWKSDDDRFRILARSETALHLCDTQHFSAVSLYNKPISSVVPNPYLRNEIIFVDECGRIWYGPAGSFARRKCKDRIEHIAATDHPRVIYAATKEKVSVVDLRISDDDEEEIYRAPHFDDSSRCSYQYRYEGAFPNPKIHFLVNLHEMPQALLIATSQRFILMDERMRGICHLELAHSLKEGGDYLFSAPSIFDARENGYIYPIFALRHSAAAEVHTFALYRHTASRMWSSVAPTFRLREPTEVVRFFKEQPKYGLIISRETEKYLCHTGPTRALCCIENSARDGLTMVRMLNDGSLWLDDFNLTANDDEQRSKVQNAAAALSGLLEKIEESLQMEESKCDDKSSEDASVTYWDIEIEELPVEKQEAVSDVQGCPEEAYGFRGALGSSASKEIPVEDEHGEVIKWCTYDSAHISQTYVALCCLVILGDDLRRVDREAVLRGIRNLQTPDGSFRDQANGEHDMRFVYCAAAICYILKGFSAINVPSLLNFIRSCINYDGGFGQAPQLESHGGSTYCAVASLALLGHLWDESVLAKEQIRRLKKWALFKQENGFHGRANKPDDSCYAFWIGGTLEILGSYGFSEKDHLRQFIISTQDSVVGGFGKYSDSIPDALHTCFGMSALAILPEPCLRPLFVPLNITQRAAEHLMQLDFGQ